MKKNMRACKTVFMIVMVAVLLSVNCFAAGTTSTASVTDLTTPIVSLINSLLGPLLAIVGALGSLYCVILGVKYAKAEEPQDREKAKQHLKNAVIGFVLIFVLMLALKILTPALSNWVAENELK